VPAAAASAAAAAAAPEPRAPRAAIFARVPEPELQPRRAATCPPEDAASDGRAARATAHGARGRQRPLEPESVEAAAEGGGGGGGVPGEWGPAGVLLDGMNDFFRFLLGPDSPSAPASDGTVSFHAAGPPSPTVPPAAPAARAAPSFAARAGASPPSAAQSPPLTWRSTGGGAGGEDGPGAAPRTVRGDGTPSWPSPGPLSGDLIRL
jgi:hypothetical protein